MDVGRFYALLRFEEAALALKTALTLNFVDRVAGREVALEDLQHEFAFTRQASRTYFSLLTVMGILETTSTDRYRVTDLARECLGSDSPSSRKPYLAMGTGDDVQQFIELMKGLTGSESIPLYEGEESGESLMDNDVVAREVSFGLASRARNFATPLAEVLSNFVDDRMKSLADVGAGSPFVAHACLEKCEHLESATLVDRPNGMHFARELAETENINLSRIRFHEGSFFDQVPQADVFILSNTAHDWNEEEYSKIIGKIVDVLPSHGMIGIHEPLMAHAWNSENEWIHALWMACYAQTLYRLTLGKGTCYTIDEHVKVMAGHGLKLVGDPGPTSDGCTLLVFQRS